MADSNRDDRPDSTTPMKHYWSGQQAPEHADAWFNYYKTIREKGTLDRKTKELIAVGASTIVRCPHCLEAHVKDALRAGATKAEVAEAITTGSMVSSGGDIFWSDKFEELLSVDSE